MVFLDIWEINKLSRTCKVNGMRLLFTTKYGYVASVGIVYGYENWVDHK